MAISPWNVDNATPDEMRTLLKSMNKEYLLPGQPMSPQYSASYDPRSMSMSPEINASLSALQMDNRGLNAYRGEALRQGPPRYAQLATERENTNEVSARDRLRSESSAKQADAESQLAMRGGLDSGARERLKRSAASDYLNMSQDIGKQAQTNRQQIAMNDEQNRMSQLGALPGMELQALNPDFEKLKLQGQAKQFDITNTVNEGTRRNLFDMNKYHEQMAAWGANKQAEATANSGKK